MLGKAVKEKSGSVSREVFECLKRQQKNLIKMDGLVRKTSLRRRGLSQLLNLTNIGYGSTGSACCLASSSLGLALAAVRNRRRKTLSRRGQIPPAISGMLAGDRNLLLRSTAVTPERKGGRSKPLLKIPFIRVIFVVVALWRDSCILVGREATLIDSSASSSCFWQSFYFACAKVLFASRYPPNRLDEESILANKHNPYTHLGAPLPAYPYKTRVRFFLVGLGGFDQKCYAYTQDYPSSRKLCGDYFTTTDDRP
ncbi:hypothetical protein Bca101_071169 [Brassica carinata]